MTTAPCPYCGRDIPLPVTFRTHPAHDTQGRLVVWVSMLRQSHRCSPKEDQCGD